MEGRQSGRQLPEHIIEMIIGRMPFPSIFKARMLSKAWLAKFSSMEVREGDCKETSSTVAAEFQKLVSERSKSWEIWGPVCICHDQYEFHAWNEASIPRYQKSYAYNRQSQTWQRIPCMPVIPMPCMSFIPEYGILSIEGALILFTRDCDGGTRRSRSTEEFYVANILTRNCKLLPARPLLGEEHEINRASIVLNPSLQTYKVVLFARIHRRNINWNSFELWVQIFDSVSCSWRSKTLVGLPHLTRDITDPCFSEAVNFNGALYMLANRCHARVLAFDMEEETLTELNYIPFDPKLAFSQSVVVCDADLFIIWSRLCPSTETHIGLRARFRILKVVLSRGTVSVVTQSRGTIFNSSSIGRGQPVVACGGCIYFGVERASPGRSTGQMPVYNVREKRWSFISPCPDGVYTSSYFRPGLNPFMAV